MTNRAAPKKQSEISTAAMLHDGALSDCDILDVTGIKVHLTKREDVLDRIEDWIAHPASTPRTIIVSGFHALIVAMEDEGFHNIVRAADLYIPDGIAPLLISRRLGFKDHGRVTGADLMQGFFELADRKGLSSYFFGDTDETLAALQESVTRSYPGHITVGTFSPPFRQHSEDELQQMIDNINNARPDILWVGLGLPKQERWIAENRARLQVPVAIGVGAAFGFHSGQLSRVPAWIGKVGFEWLWRLMMEPKRLWRRLLVDGPRFLWLVWRRWEEIKSSNTP